MFFEHDYVHEHEQVYVYVYEYETGMLSDNNMVADQIKIHDVTIREGSQNPKQLGGRSVEEKINLCTRIADTGVSSIELTAFAPGEWFEDADELAVELASAVEKSNIVFRNKDAEIEAIYFNLKGFERLKNFPHIKQQGIFHTALTEEYRIKNYNQKDTNDVLAKYEKHLTEFKNSAVPFANLVLSTFFGDKKQKIKFNQVLSFLIPLLNISSAQGVFPEQITIADTEGTVSAYQLEIFINELKKEFPKQNLKLHLHPIKEDAVKLCETALKCGIKEFDVAVCGVGGSPFSESKRGNLDIQDLLRACEKQNIATGIYAEKLKSAEDYLLTLIK